MVSTEFDELVQRARTALDRILNGDPEAYKPLFSRSEGITLGNPFGGFARGWDQVVEQLERAASYYRDGHTNSFETIEQVVTSEFAYTVEIERFSAKVGGSRELSDIALRVTCIYRRERDGWKVVHRHADPRVSRQTAESVVRA